MHEENEKTTSRRRPQSMDERKRRRQKRTTIHQWWRPKMHEEQRRNTKFQIKVWRKRAAVAKQERKTVAKRGDVRCSERRQEFSIKHQKKKRMQRHKRQQHCWGKDTAEKRRRRRDQIHCDSKECDIIVLKRPCRGVGTWSMWLQMGRTPDLRIMETRKSRAMDDTPRPYIHGSWEIPKQTRS